MNCPKCKLLLFGTAKEYYCMGCGLHGTYLEMAKQAEQVSARMTERASKVECKSCGKRKILSREITCSTRNGKSEYICYDCQKSK